MGGALERLFLSSLESSMLRKSLMTLVPTWVFSWGLPLVTIGVQQLPKNFKSFHSVISVFSYKLLF